MADSTELSSTQASQNITSSIESSSLLNRLDRRRTAPVGVVNLEQFNTRAAQVPGWIVQRSTLLNELTTRYSSDANASEQGDALILASSQPVLPNELRTEAQSSNSFAPPVSQAVSSPATVTTTSTTPAFRVSRKPASFPTIRSGSPIESAPQPALTLPTLPPSDPSSSTRRADLSNPSAPPIIPQNQTGSVPQKSLSSVEPATPSLSSDLPIAKETPSISPASQPSSQALILPKRGNSSAESQPTTVLQTKVDPTQSYQGSMHVRPHSDSIPSIASAPLTRSSNQLSNQPFVLVKPESNQANHKLTPNLSFNVEKVAQPSVSSNISANISSATTPPITLPIVRENPVTSQQLHQSSQTLVLPKRNNQPVANPAADFVDSSNKKTIRSQKHSDASPYSQPQQDNTAANFTVSAYPTAPELPVTVMPLEQHSLIWRKSAGTNSTHASPLQIQQSASAISRAHTSQSSMISSSAEPSLPAPTEATPSSMSAPNTAQLAEQVGRILHRQLTVERERRGIQLW